MALVQIGSLSLQLNRKAIKNLHISVLPPDGRIRVSAPEQMTDTAIRMAVVSRIPWIKNSSATLLRNPGSQIERWSVANAITFGVSGID